jgi:hypothetical protein
MTLQNEITTDPHSIGYAPLVAAGNHAGIHELINRPEASRMLPRSRFVTGRAVLAELGVTGAVVLEKLSVFGATPQQVEAEGLRLAIKWAMKFADQEGEGLDIGHPTTRQLLQTCAAVGVLTEPEATALMALAVFPTSRAVELFGREVSVTEISEALSNGG